MCIRDSSLIEEFYYPKFGPGQLWETAAREFEKMGGRIEKGCKVVRILTEGAEVKGVVFERNGKEETLEGDLVISSMPVSYTHLRILIETWEFIHSSDGNILVWMDEVEMYNAGGAKSISVDKGSLALAVGGNETITASRCV